MKKLFLGLLSVAVSTSAMAQKNPKSALSNASMNLEIYTADSKLTKNLLEAKEDIDYASTHEQTKDNPKVWRYRGQIYNSIAANPALKKDEKTAPIKALQSFTKAWELDVEKLKEKGKPVTKIGGKADYKMGFEKVASALYNTGAEAYNNKEYELAYACFSGIQKIAPLTNEGLSKRPVNLITPNKINLEQEGARLGGISATYMGSCEEAERLLLPLLEGGKVAEASIPATYSLIANCYDKGGNSSKAKEIVAKARKKYPTNQSLLVAEINFALKDGNLAAIESKLKQAVEGDKENVELHFVLGNVYDELFRTKMEEGKRKEAAEFFGKAVDWYKKAANLDAKHFNTAYSLGAIYVNYSNTVVKDINEITDFNSPKLKSLETEYQDLLSSALKYLLAAESINKEDLGTAIALKEVYARQQNEEKAMEYSKRVKELQK